MSPPTNAARTIHRRNTLRFIGPILFSILCVEAFAQPPAGAVASEPAMSAEKLKERFQLEQQPIWADGDTATIFYEGTAEEASVWLGGKRFPLSRIPDSQVWFAQETFEHLNRGILNYRFMLAGANRTTKRPTNRLNGEANILHHP